MESSDLAATASATSDLTRKFDHPILNANKEFIESFELDGCARKSSNLLRAVVIPDVAPSLWETRQKMAQIALNWKILEYLTK